MERASEIDRASPATTNAHTRQSFGLVVGMKHTHIDYITWERVANVGGAEQNLGALGI
jgi:hypothetical protein